MFRKKQSDKKCCLNCAFCIRSRYYGGKFLLSGISTQGYYKQDTLGRKQRESLRNNDSSFIGEEKRISDEWIKELEKRAEEERRKTEANIENIAHPAMKSFAKTVSLIQDVDPIFGNGYAKKAERLGMGEQPPTPPDDDLICCHKDQWTEQEKTARDNDNSIPNRGCEFFFPFEGCEGLIIEGIERKQIHQLELDNATATKNGVRLSKIGLWISIIAIVISAGVTVFYNIRDSQSNNEWRDKELEAIRNIPSNAKEIKELNDSVKQNTEVLKQIQNHLKTLPATTAPKKD